MDENVTPAPEEMTEGTRVNTSPKHYAAFGLLALIALSMVVVLVFVLRGPSDQSTETPVAVVTEATDFRTSLQLSVGGDDPKPLQDFFAEKAAAEIRDDEAKSAIYWITHRYFDNGGDINEIYDFVEATPAVAFLKEAEIVYPTVFAKVKDGSIGKYSGESMLALLAYYEVIDRYGYGDIAIWGIAANKHAEMAYRWRQRYEQDPTRTYEPGEVHSLEFSALMIQKSRYFLDQMRDFLLINTQKTYTLEDLNSLAIIPDDLLVGLNQYSAAIENAISVGTEPDNLPYTTEQIYEFNYELAKTKVPRLYFFTNYLYAASLVSSGRANPDTVALPLDRIVAYVKATPAADWSGSVSRVINSKVAGEVGMYDPAVVKSLAAFHPAFKEFLMTQGWTSSDF